MPKQVNMLWSDETLQKSEALLVATRKATGENITRTQLVEAMIDQAHAQLGKVEKRIEPVMAERMIGKKRFTSISGWKAFYGDHLVIETDGAASKPQAEQALDAYVWEELHK